MFRGKICICGFFIQIQTNMRLRVLAYVFTCLFVFLWKIAERNRTRSLALPAHITCIHLIRTQHEMLHNSDNYSTTLVRMNGCANCMVYGQHIERKERMLTPHGVDSKP